MFFSLRGKSLLSAEWARGIREADIETAAAVFPKRSISLSTHTRVEWRRLVVHRLLQYRRRKKYRGKKEAEVSITLGKDRRLLDPTVGD